MKKNKNLYLLSAGLMSVSPLLTVLSCGTEKTEVPKENEASWKGFDKSRISSLIQDLSGNPTFDFITELTNGFSSLIASFNNAGIITPTSIFDVAKSFISNLLSGKLSASASKFTIAGQTIDLNKIFPTIKTIITQMLESLLLKEQKSLGLSPDNLVPENIKIMDFVDKTVGFLFDSIPSFIDGTFDLSNITNLISNASSPINLFLDSISGKIVEELKDRVISKMNDGPSKVLLQFVVNYINNLKEQFKSAGFGGLFGDISKASNINNEILAIKTLFTDKTKSNELIKIFTIPLIKSIANDQKNIIDSFTFTNQNGSFSSKFADLLNSKLLTKSDDIDKDHFITKDIASIGSGIMGIIGNFAKLFDPIKSIIPKTDDQWIDKFKQFTGDIVVNLLSSIISPPSPEFISLFESLKRIILPLSPILFGSNIKHFDDALINNKDNPIEAIRKILQIKLDLNTTTQLSNVNSTPTLMDLFTDNNRLDIIKEIAINFFDNNIGIYATKLSNSKTFPSLGTLFGNLQKLLSDLINGQTAIDSIKNLKIIETSFSVLSDLIDIEVKKLFDDIIAKSNINLGPISSIILKPLKDYLYSFTSNKDSVLKTLSKEIEVTVFGNPNGSPHKFDSSSVIQSLKDFMPMLEQYGIFAGIGAAGAAVYFSPNLFEYLTNYIINKFNLTGDIENKLKNIPNLMKIKIDEIVQIISSNNKTIPDLVSESIKKFLEFLDFNLISLTPTGSNTATDYSILGLLQILTFGLGFEKNTLNQLSGIGVNLNSIKPITDFIFQMNSLTINGSPAVGNVQQTSTLQATNSLQSISMFLTGALIQIKDTNNGFINYLTNTIMNGNHVYPIDLIKNIFSGTKGVISDPRKITNGQLPLITLNVADPATPNSKTWDVDWLTLNQLMVENASVLPQGVKASDYSTIALEKIIEIEFKELIKLPIIFILNNLGFKGDTNTLSAFQNNNFVGIIVSILDNLKINNSNGQSSILETVKTFINNLSSNNNIFSTLIGKTLNPIIDLLSKVKLWLENPNGNNLTNDDVYNSIVDAFAADHVITDPHISDFVGPNGIIEVNNGSIIIHKTTMGHLLNIFSYLFNSSPSLTTLFNDFLNKNLNKEIISNEIKLDLNNLIQPLFDLISNPLNKIIEESQNYVKTTHRSISVSSIYNKH
ncbi:MAG: hypothetical protein K4H23_04720 [Mollicutes bacterium PWAP]|nr:hypothetical protein [Mollicutes bacterium PWAP]